MQSRWSVHSVSLCACEQGGQADSSAESALVRSLGAGRRGSQESGSDLTRGSLNIKLRSLNYLETLGAAQF